MKAQRKKYSYTLSLTSAVDGVGGQRHALIAPPPGNRPGTYCIGPVWTGAETLVLTGIRFPDRPARSESLYRLSYPGPQIARNAFLSTL